MTKLFAVFAGMFLVISVYAQQKTDSLPVKELTEVIFKTWLKKDVSRLPEKTGAFLYSGKKSEVINMSGTNANLALKTGRQIFAKIPGVFVYDMDGSGNQLNIATRGLDAHRSWEFNIRQNGVLLNSDMYGYPASHFSAPMESYDRIELVRGSGSLQYGAQFGGMINMITKQPDSTRLLSFESINTVGSYKLMSTYTAVSGTYKKFSYYAYYHQRGADGYRKNSASDASAQYLLLQYAFSDKLKIKGEISRSKYQHRIPGPLTDKMFQEDPQQSTRGRNYFSPDILVPSLTLSWQVTPSTYMQLQASGVFGQRNSVMLDAFANVPDSIVPSTNDFRNRQVDRDQFNSKTIEWRVVQSYKLAQQSANLAAGVVYMNNDLHRRQQGRGTTGTDYDLTLVDQDYGRDMHFKTGNLAFFVENTFTIGNRFSISPGWRMETGRSDMTGKIRYYTQYPIPNRIAHNYHLFGVSTQFKLDTENTVYGGISNAYRPVIFKDIVPASTYEQVDKSLRNATGYNAEIGVRGKWGDYFQYDLSLFRVIYNDRLGAVVREDQGLDPYIFRTNIGDSRTNGVELFAQYKYPVANHFFLGLFTSTSYMDAVYLNGQLADAGTNKSIRGNRLEAVPRWITRNGLECLFKGLSATLLYSYTSETFSDPLNTIAPPASGARGLTPAYGLWDLNIAVPAGRYLNVRGGLNNIFNKQYFTKRPTFYPGPGIWPGDGRNWYLTVGVKI